MIRKDQGQEVDEGDRLAKQCSSRGCLVWQPKLSRAEQFRAIPYIKFLATQPPYGPKAVMVHLSS
jgi:hypothetical protein